MVTQSDASQADRFAQPAPGRTIELRHGLDAVAFPPTAPSERVVRTARANPATWSRVRAYAVEHGCPEEHATMEVATATAGWVQFVIVHHAVHPPTSDTERARLELAHIRVGKG